MSQILNLNKSFLEKLPQPVFESILSLLSYSDIINLQTLSSYLFETCVNHVGRLLNKLRKTVYNSMVKYYKDINFVAVDHIKSKQFLKIYNILESIEESLNMVIVLNCHKVENGDTRFPVGAILNKYYSILNEVTKENLKLHRLSFLNINLQRFVGKMIEDVGYYNIKLADSAPLGIRCIDFLDLIRNMLYKLLTYLPLIPYVKNCQDRPLTVEEQKAVLKYLMMLVNVHNKLESKGEHYKRDLEVSKRETILKQENEFKDHVIAKLPPCTKARKSVKRIIIEPGEGKIKEVYQNFNSWIVPKQGMKCTAKFKCNINEAPLCVQASYETLKSDIEMDDPSIKPVNNDVFKNVMPKNNIYELSFRLRVILPTKVPEIFEVYFQDGNK